MSIPDLGQLSLWAAFVLGAAGTAASALELRGRLAGWATPLWIAAAAAVAAGFATLVVLFQIGDLSTATVFFYTRTDFDWPWKLAGVWSGRQGSLLLWTTLLSLVVATVAWLDARRVVTDEAEARGRRWTRFFLGLALTAFLAAVAGQDTFAATSPALLAGRPLGNGLNPTLRSGFILIHPPMMFTAYALATVPAAAVLAHLASGTDRWSRIALGPSRLGWMLFTVAISLGALWAYTTLGFGGYWAWDPVEVANLLPWLALTLYLHVQLRHRDSGAYPVAGPLLGLLPLLLSLFSTISTRSGLWVSVHAFTDPTDTFEPDAARRLLNILVVEPSLAFYTAVLLGGLFLFLALWCHRLARSTGRLQRVAPVLVAGLAALAAWAAADPASLLAGAFQLAHDATGGQTAYGLLALVFGVFLLGAAPALAGPSEARKAKGMAAFAGYSVLVLTLALLVLVLFHLAAVNGWSTAFYEARFPWLSLPVVLGLVVFQAHALLGRRGLWLAAGTLVAALAAWRIGGPLWLLLLPCLVLLAVGLARTRAALGGTGGRDGLARSFLLLASLADLLFWSNPPADAGFTVPWTLQVLLLLASVAAVLLACRAVAAQKQTGPAALLSGILGGFLVAPALALAAFLLLRRSVAEPAKANVARARMLQASLYAVHLAVALVLAGYAASTYAKHEERAEVTATHGLDVGGFHLAYLGTGTTGPAGAGADKIRPAFAWSTHDDSGRLAGILDWEDQVQAHLPRPAIARTWTTDVYVEVEAVHAAAGGPCAPDHPDGYWIQAYQGQVPSRVCTGAAVDAVKVRAVTLPGLGLLWGGVALAVLAMGLRLALARPASAPA